MDLEPLTTRTQLLGTRQAADLLGSPVGRVVVAAGNRIQAAYEGRFCAQFGAGVRPWRESSQHLELLGEHLAQARVGFVEQQRQGLIDLTGGHLQSSQVE